MPLESIPIPVAELTLPDEVEEFLDDADRRIKEYFAHHPDRPVGGFVPSDYPSIYRTLHGLIDIGFDPGLFCEWGSGFGVIAGIAATLGHEAHAIEIDGDLLDRSTALLNDHEIDVQLHHGSYVPTGFDETENAEDFFTIVPGSAVYDEVDFTVDDLDFVYVFPWPGTEPLHFAMFDRFAAPGAILISHHGVDGNRVQRKVD